MRTHGLVQSTQLLQLVARATPIEHDLSLYLPRTPGLRPVHYRFGERPLVRLPYLWEDDFEMLQGAPWWGLAPVLGLGEGLKVLDFHPVHVFLNLPQFAAYAALRDAGRLNGQASAEALRPHIHQGAGPRKMFGEALEHLSRSGRSWRVQDLCAAALPPPLPPEMPEAGEARP
jgi:hypothetical protein